MKAVLISIRPKWCEMIASGKKTVEVRKSRPKLEPPFKCYIYETRGFERVGNENLNCVVGGNGRGTVIGEFVCDGIAHIQFELFDDSKCDGDGFYQWWECSEEWALSLDRCACLTDNEFFDYLGTKGGYGWHISDLVIYNMPKQLSEFTGLQKTKFGYAPYEITRPPQSWCYVEELP